MWDFKGRSRNEILAWAQELSHRDRAALNQKLDFLEKLDFDQALSLKLLAGPVRGSGHILKLRAAADSALRPLLCRGPQAPFREYTLLKGAVERDWKLHPAGALERAIENRKIIQEDESRRTKHERP